MKNIFISSTFIDMQAERDLVQERVLPALRDEARKYGDNVGVIDLRWGVDTSTLETEEGAEKVLKVCLDEIDRSHPYMLIFLGERYGTMMREDQIGKSVRGREDKYTTDDYVKSITALEVEYGALSEKYGELNHCVVCFREPVVHMLDGAEKELYAEHTEEGKRKLEALKERIKRDLGADDRLITYSCTWDKSARQLVDFTSNGQPLEHVLTNCFVEMFRDDWKEYEALSWQDKEQLAFRALMESKLRSFVGREALLEEYYQSAVNGNCPIILQGEVGSGKTAIMCKLVERLQKEGKNVFAFFSGVGSMSTNAESLVKQMVYYMENLLGEEKYFGEENAFVEMEEGFEKGVLRYSDWMDRLRELCYRLPEEKKVYVCIDALDQMYFDEHVEKLDFLIRGKGVQFVASCTKEFKVPMNAMEERDVKSVPALNESDAKAVAESILASYSRNAYESIEQEILKKKSIGSPLYISLLIQRLNMMDAEELRKAMTEEEIVALGTKIVREMPDTLEDATVSIIQNGIAKVSDNDDMLRETLGYLAVSRNGLRMQDLQGIFSLQNKDFPILDVTLLLSYLDSFFYVNEDGRIDFKHKVIRGGLLKGINNRKQYEEGIKNYLLAVGVEDELTIKEGLYYARIFEEYAFAQKLIIHAHDTEDKVVFRAIKDVALEDEGEFLENVINLTGENQKKLISFFVNKSSKVFESSEAERKIKLRIGQLAHKICEKAFEENRKENDAIDLAACLLFVGREMREAGDVLLSEKYINMATEHYVRIQQKNTNWENTFGLINAYIAITLLPTTTEDTKNELYVRIATLLESFQRDQSFDVQNLLSVLFVNMGVLSMRKGEYTSARRRFETAVEYRKSLAKKIGTEGAWIFYYDAYEHLGDSLREEGKFETARECFGECLAGRKMLYTKNSSIKNLRDLLQGYMKMGHVILLEEFADTKKGEARDYFLEALLCAEELYKIESSTLSLKELATICNDLATTYIYEEGKEKQSLEYCEKAQKYAEMLYKKESSREVEELLIKVYQVSSSVYGTVGRAKEQKECSEKAIYYAKKNQEQTGDYDSRIMLAVIYASKAQDMLDEGDDIEVIEYCKKTIECIGEDRATPLDFKELGVLVWVYPMMENAFLNIGDSEAAERASCKCLEYEKEMKTRFPECSKSAGIDELLEEEDNDEESTEQNKILLAEIQKQVEYTKPLILFEVTGSFESSEYAGFYDKIKELEMDYKIVDREVLEQAFSNEIYSHLREHLNNRNGIIFGKTENKSIKILKYAMREEDVEIQAAVIEGIYYGTEDISFLIKFMRLDKAKRRLLLDLMPLEKEVAVDDKRLSKSEDNQEKIKKGKTKRKKVKQRGKTK